MKITSIDKDIDQKIDFYHKSIIAPVNPKTKEAIIVYFFYKELINEMNKNTLYLFIKAHLKFNKNITIYLFTNQELDLSEISKDRLIIQFLNYQDDKIMTNRVTFNYTIMKLFYVFRKLYFFDSDLIPVDFYDDLFSDDFDVGLTFNPIYKKLKKFPINAGFLILNYKNLDNVNNFISRYLTSYKQALLNEKNFIKTYNLKNSLSKWYGDQYLFQFLIKELPKKRMSNFIDLKENSYSIRLFDEYRYNYYSYELKEMLKAKINKLTIFGFLELCKKHRVSFIHLKGTRRLFANDLSKNLI